MIHPAGRPLGFVRPDSQLPKVAGLVVKGERSESQVTRNALDGQAGDLTITCGGEDEASQPQILGRLVMSEYLFRSSASSVLEAGVPAIPPNLWDLPADEVPPLLLRPEDVARLLNVSRAKVYGLMRRRELRSVKFDGCRRVSAMALREYVEGLDSGDAA